jgi:hypothetical protein
MGRGVVYALTLGFAALLAFLTVRVLLQRGVTLMVVAAFFILALVVLGALGVLGRREES